MRCTSAAGIACIMFFTPSEYRVVGARLCTPSAEITASFPAMHCQIFSRLKHIALDDFEAFMLKCHRGRMAGNGCHLMTCGERLLYDLRTDTTCPPNTTSFILTEAPQDEDPENERHGNKESRRG